MKHQKSNKDLVASSTQEDDSRTLTLSSNATAPHEASKKNNADKITKFPNEYKNPDTMMHIKEYEENEAVSYSSMPI